MPIENRFFSEISAEKTDFLFPGDDSVIDGWWEGILVKPSMHNIPERLPFQSMAKNVGRKDKSPEPNDCKLLMRERF